MSFELQPCYLNDQSQLFSGIMTFSSMLKAVYQANKLNIAILGNIFSQLHVPIMVRYKTGKAEALLKKLKLQSPNFQIILLEK